MAGLIYRENRVPYYQRLFQRDDGVRQWWKTPRSKYMLYPYFACLGAGLAGTMYCMTRMAMGKKTWFSD
ncbi:hypothetical protein BDZ91DRAFT_724894 [Kalaharituber pfeilii]|nr:hypothetical protein BDZ91DRAFT_724894 [Kalaharituber pfeilii]